jgi:DNA-binding CsgD family transcriptional regulator
VVDMLRNCGKGPCRELEMLRSHVLFLERERERQAEIWRENERLDLSLQERTKELNCLYSVEDLIDRHEDSLDFLLQEIVKMLPNSWQYPEVASARILFKGQTYQTVNFKPTRWKQEVLISIAGQHLGSIQVCYLKKQPTHDEGPFLKEERLLLNAISDRIVKASEKIDMEQQLQAERRALQDANTALHDTLIRVQQEKKMLGASIQANIDKVISPILFALKPGLDAKYLTYANLLKKNLDNIVTPLFEKTPDTHSRLSPVEQLICNMIKYGLSTKEIAEIRGISPDTVNRHRENIRRKLGLINSKANLVSYLNSIPE